VIRRVLLSASRSEALHQLSVNAPVARSVVKRFIAGDTTRDAVSVAAGLASTGLMSTIDHLGEDTVTVEHADAVREAYLELLTLLADAGLGASAEVSVKLSAIGQALPTDGVAISTENALRIAAAADEVGTTVTVDMEDHTTTDRTLATVAALRAEFPATGAVLQAYLHRTEADCRDLAGPGSRVRLCKGAYKEPESVAFQGRSEVDLNYVRCLKVLMAGEAYPMMATHDPRLIEIAEALAVRAGRRPDEYEYQMLLGVRPDEQRRLAANGGQVRVYVPYGAEWYGYMVRRVAEKPANLALLLRSLTSSK
jgi:proline dehydrogenase